MLVLLARCMGAPLGEAVAEDFDFLRRVLLSGMGSLADGGGSSAFWRPLAHQVYYAALGSLILDHPRIVALVHAVLLAAGAVLVCRALRPHLGGAAACVASTFPMLAESTRTLVGWPSQFVDVGLYFFTAVALYATARGRLALALGSTLLALFCKELAVIPALLLPWFPDARPRATRRRWAIAFAVLLAAWGAAYLAVRETAHLRLPHGLEEGAPAATLLQRLAWAFGGSLRAIASLARAPAQEDGLALALGLGLALAIAATLALVPAARGRLRARRAWLAWGGAWYVAGTLALAPIFPLWQPNRVHFGSAGFGIAVAAAAEAAHPAIALGLVLSRGALLALAPPAASVITEAPPQTGAFMDFAQLSRLQRFMALTRRALRTGYPVAEHHASVVEMNLPHGLIYALGGDHAVQVWYRDTTVRMVNFTRLARDSALAMVAGVQFQPDASVQIVLLSPDAMRTQDLAYRHLLAHRWEAALAALDRADALEPDTLHRVFRGNNAGYRAVALLNLDRMAEAEAQARRSVSLDDTDPNGLRTLATVLALRGRYDDALAEADRLLSLDPNEPSVLRLRESILHARAAARGN